VISVAAAIEASSLSRILAVTTDDVNVLVAGNTDNIGYKLKAAAMPVRSGSTAPAANTPLSRPLVVRSR
jgi:hypothetical protein